MEYRRRVAVSGVMAERYWLCSYLQPDGRCCHRGNLPLAGMAVGETRCASQWWTAYHTRNGPQCHHRTEKQIEGRTNFRSGRYFPANDYERRFCGILNAGGL